MTDLKLIALDGDDLTVLAAHMQDAVLKIGDLAYDRRRRQFALTANRFVWEVAGGRFRRTFQRRLASMHFNRVLSVRSRGFGQDEENRVLSLLTVQFFPDTVEGSAGGDIELIFADDASILLSIECIEVQLADLGPAWETRHRPKHPRRP